MAKKNVGPKLWCVVVRDEAPDGSITVRPMKSAVELGSFPDACRSRFQAKKLLAKAQFQFPSARLGHHQEIH